MPWFIPLALAAAGAGLSYAGQRKAAKAQEQVLTDYRSRNKQREAEANAIYEQSLAQSGVDTADTALDKGTKRRLTAYESLGDALPAQALPTTAKGDTLVKTPTTKNTGTVWEKLMNNAQAKLGSYADWQLQQGIKDNRANQSISRVTTDAKSDWNNVVPVEMTAASHKGDALQGWGQLLSAAGMVSGMSAALSTGGAGAGGAATWESSVSAAADWSAPVKDWQSIALGN